MNPVSLMTEGEQEFIAQEKGITEAVIRVIGVAKKENALIDNEDVQQSVVDACKAAVAKTQQFKAYTQGMHLLLPFFSLVDSVFTSLLGHLRRTCGFERHNRPMCVGVCVSTELKNLSTPLVVSILLLTLPDSH